MTEKFRKYWELLVPALIAILFLPAKYIAIFIVSTDYPFHIADAQRWYEQRHYFGAPHFLFELLVIVTKVVTFTDWKVAGLILDIVFYFLIARLLLLETFRRCGNAWLSSITSFLLILSWPLFVFLWLADRKIYGGYIGTNVYHNPTMVILKPFAFYIQLRLIQALDNRAWQFSLRKSLWIMACVVLATVAKPNYTIDLLPTLFVFFVICGFPLFRNPWKQIIGFVVLPAVVVLLAQFLSHFDNGISSGAAGRGIIFAPFVMERLASKYLFPKFIFSIAFPLCVLILYFKTAVREVGLQFSWVCFLFGAFYTYFLAESGNDLPAGNFGWCSQISLFLLFIFSAFFLLEENQRRPLKYRNFLYGLLILHGICGLIAYCRQDIVF